jgi:hypothetical protein
VLTAAVNADAHASAQAIDPTQLTLPDLELVGDCRVCDRCLWIEDQNRLSISMAIEALPVPDRPHPLRETELRRY